MQRISGWLQSSTGSNFVHVHAPTERMHRVAILIIPGLGNDGFHGYRALRFLADSLCEQAFLTIRMELTGTGNCSEAHRRIDPATWDNDVTRTLDWLRRCEQIDQICCVANRTGGLFLASALAPCDDLVLWGVCTGRTWVREQTALRRLSPGTEQGNPVESGGLVLGSESTSGIAERLPVVEQHIRRILMLDRVDRPTPADLKAQLSSKAGTFDYRLDVDYANCFREPHNAVRPDAATRCIVEWIGSASGSLEQISAASLLAELVAGGLQFHAGIESVQRCNGVFGILSKPAGADSIVLLGNAGAVHHVGPNRLNVELARKLAMQKVATLRYDLSNLGDSVCEGLYADVSVREENHPYPESAERDLSALVNWARAEGFRRIILAGLCSGAYAAFDFARGRHSFKPDEVLLINPLTFHWRPGMSLEIPDEFRTAARSSAYRGAMADAGRWRRLLTGQVSYGGIFIHLCTALLDRLHFWTKAMGVALHLLPRPQLEGDLLRIAASGIRLRFFFSSNEPGIDMLNGAGRSCLDALRRLHLMSIELIDKADHTFRSSNKRAELTAAILRTVATEHDRSQP